MAGYCRDACHGLWHDEDEAGWVTTERARDAEWDIPLCWVTVAIGGLSAISLGLGLALKWLLQ